MKTIRPVLLLVATVFIAISGNCQFSSNLMSSPATEPSWNWAAQMGGPAGPMATSITYDQTGNTYVTGYFNGKIKFGNDSLTSVGSYDLFIVKYDPSGNETWLKQVSGDPGDSLMPVKIVLLNNDAIYIAGNFTGTANFAGNQLNSTGKRDVFVAKFNNSGINTWAAKYGDSGDQEATSAALDASGFSFIVLNNPGTIFAKIASFNPSGSFVQVKTYNQAYFNDIASNGTAMFVTGYITAATSLGTTNLSSGTYPSSFLGKTDLNGSFLWANNTKSATGESKAYSVVLDNSGGGGVFNSGYYTDSIRFNTPGVQLITNSGTYPVFVAKYNSSGACSWAGQAAENNTVSYSSQVALDAGGNPFLFSSANSDFLFGPSQLTGTIPFMAKFDMNGVPQWASQELVYPVSGCILQNRDIVEVVNNNYKILLIKYNYVGELVWTKNSSSNGGMADVWYQIAMDRAGFTYVHGHILGSGLFLGTNLQANGAFLAKVRGDGVLYWIKSFKMPSMNNMVDPSGITTDSDGNSYAWGVFSDSLNIEGNLLTNSHPGGSSGYLVKYDKEGVFQWVRSFQCTRTIIGTGGITLDHVGNIVIVGNFSDSLQIGTTILTSNGGQDFFIARFKYDGTPLMAKNAGGTQTDWGRGVATDSLNYIYVAGGFRGTCNFGIHTLTSLGGYDGFLAKYDPSGNEIWSRQMGGIGTETAHNIATDKSGNSYISGRFWGNQMQFGSITITSPGVWNMFVCKYDATGTPVWGHELSSPDYTWPAYQMGLDEEGSCYVGGQYQYTLTFHNGAMITANNYNSFLAKYNTSGTYQWNKNINTSNGFSSLMGLAVYDKNSLMIGGRIYSDQIIFGSDTIASMSSNAFIALLGNDLPVGIKRIDHSLNGFEVYPNPASGYLFVKFNDVPSTRITWSLVDGSGKSILGGQSNANQTIRIDLPNVTEGIYYLSVISGGKIYSEKVMIR